jgi:hypothetical protein
LATELKTYTIVLSCIKLEELEHPRQAQVHFKKFKNDPNHVKPLRGVILYVIVTRKNIKVGKLQTSQKFLHKMSYHGQGFNYI